MFNFYLRNHWFFTVFGGIALLFLSLMPAGPANPLSWIKLLHIDKVAHVVAYCMWSFALIISITKQYINTTLRFRKTFLAITLAILYGVLMETLQATISVDRVGEWSDIVANVIGCVLGLAVFQWIVKSDNLKLRNHDNSQNKQCKS